MPEIMIRCPTLGYAVKTGLRTEAVKLESLERSVPIPLRCPACRKLHKWQHRDAWADTGNGHDLSLMRVAPAPTRVAPAPIAPAAIAPCAGLPKRNRPPPLWFWDSL